MIVPARNEGAGIDRCLSALQAQDIGGFEIVVVDNGSTDDTAARAAAFPVTLVSEPRPGPAAARNAGIRKARGAMLAFTDADCVPQPDWLRQLLAGADDEETGCFVGEIVPLDPLNPVARRLHMREDICPLRLLSQSPPVAATGNIAYRRSVFEAIGLFDETFDCGEDGDLFWRMVRSGQFRYRYHPNAVVAHNHPAGLLELFRRSFHEGRGLTRFRRKHAADLPRSLSSGPFAVAGFARALAGCALYPVRVAQALRAGGLPLRQALTQPLIDKAVSLGRMAGVLQEYRRGPTFAPQMGPAAAVTPDGFHDNVRLDLASARLLAAAPAGLDGRVRSELSRISRGLADLFPGASILLTGSLFAGEGRMDDGCSEPALSSDYDFFIVTPRLADALPFLARPRINRLIASLPPRCAPMEIGLVWTPLLRQHRTTIGGALVAGSDEALELLHGLPAPRGFSTLLQAYRHLTAAPLDPSRYAATCAGGLVRAARAVLFAEQAGRPRNNWIALFSSEVVARRIAGWAPVVGPDAVAAVRQAADFLLGRSAAGPDPARHAESVRFAEVFARRVPPPRAGVFAAKQVIRLLREGRGAFTGLNAAAWLLNGLQSLAAAWAPAGPDAAKLDAVRDMARRAGLRIVPGEGNTHALYASLQRGLSHAACFNPHRISYGRNGGPA